MKKVIGITLSLIGIIMVVISLVLKVNERVSVIGGADGPTSILSSRCGDYSPHPSTEPDVRLSRIRLFAKLIIPQLS